MLSPPGMATAVPYRRKRPLLYQLKNEFETSHSRQENYLSNNLKVGEYIRGGVEGQRGETAPSTKGVAFL